MLAKLSGTDGQNFSCYLRVGGSERIIPLVTAGAIFSRYPSNWSFTDVDDGWQLSICDLIGVSPKHMCFEIRDCRERKRSAEEAVVFVSVRFKLMREPSMSIAKHFDIAILKSADVRLEVMKHMFLPRTLPSNPHQRKTMRALEGIHAMRGFLDVYNMQLIAANLVCHRCGVRELRPAIVHGLFCRIELARYQSRGSCECKGACWPILIRRSDLCGLVFLSLSLSPPVVTRQNIECVLTLDMIVMAFPSCCTDRTFPRVCLGTFSSDRTDGGCSTDPAPSLSW